MLLPAVLLRHKKISGALFLGITLNLRCNALPDTQTPPISIHPILRVSSGLAKLATGYALTHLVNKKMGSRFILPHQSYTNLFMFLGTALVKRVGIDYTLDCAATTIHKKMFPHAADDGTKIKSRTATIKTCFRHVQSISSWYSFVCFCPGLDKLRKQTFLTVVGEAILLKYSIGFAINEKNLLKIVRNLGTRLVKKFVHKLFYQNEKSPTGTQTSPSPAVSIPKTAPVMPLVHDANSI